MFVKIPIEQFIDILELHPFLLADITRFEKYVLPRLKIIANESDEGKLLAKQILLRKPNKDRWKKELYFHSLAWSVSEKAEKFVKSLNFTYEDFKTLLEMGQIAIVVTLLQENNFDSNALKNLLFIEAENGQKTLLYRLSCEEKVLAAKPLVDKLDPRDLYLVLRQLFNEMGRHQLSIQKEAQAFVDLLPWLGKINSEH